MEDLEWTLTNDFEKRKEQESNESHKNYQHLLPDLNESQCGREQKSCKLMKLSPKLALKHYPELSAKITLYCLRSV
jgi:hypothetical protein